MALQLELLEDSGVTCTAHVSAFSALVAFAAQDDPTLPLGEWDVSVRLTDDKRIAEIHRDFFGDDSATDVMSFPSGDALTAASGYLGDIVISVDTAKDNAASVGHSTEREVAFLILHGLLHLAGHDDATPEEKRQMLERQQSILEAFERAHGRPW